MNKIINWTRLSVLTAATALTLALSATAHAQNEGTAKGGAQKLMMGRPLKQEADFAKVKNGDIVTSTCPMCKTTSYKRIDTAKGGAALHESGKAQCPGCDSMAADGQVKHACKKCGADMICCVIPGHDADGHKHDGHKKDDHKQE